MYINIWNHQPDPFFHGSPFPHLHVAPTGGFQRPECQASNPHGVPPVMTSFVRKMEMKHQIWGSLCSKCSRKMKCLKKKESGSATERAWRLLKSFFLCARVRWLSAWKLISHSRNTSPGFFFFSGRASRSKVDINPQGPPNIHQWGKTMETGFIQILDMLHRSSSHNLDLGISYLQLCHAEWFEGVCQV